MNVYCWGIEMYVIQSLDMGDVQTLQDLAIRMTFRLAAVMCWWLWASSCPESVQRKPQDEQWEIGDANLKSQPTSSLGETSDRNVTSPKCRHHLQTSQWVLEEISLQWWLSHPKKWFVGVEDLKCQINVLEFVVSTGAPWSPLWSPFSQSHKTRQNQPHW